MPELAPVVTTVRESFTRPQVTMRAGAPGSLVGIRFVFRKEPSVTSPDTFDTATALAARRVSEVSVVWTVVASTVAITLGVVSGSAVLTAFGAIGIVDAIGSVALVHHFRHALRTEALSDRFERRAHYIVIAGLGIIGITTIVASAFLLITDASADASGAGAVVAAVSLVALGALSARKQWVAGRVGSRALRADGHLSAIGALQAAVALAGLVAAERFGWEWADAVAAIVVGMVALALAILSWTGPSVI
jgi:divalent metal cation (Fe/Co/Zn/Cd) transporter